MSSSIRAYAEGDAVTDHTVVIVDNDNNTYHASVDAEGHFEITLPSSTACAISLLDGDSKYFGPTIMVGDSSAPVMSILPTDDFDFGQIVVDASAGIAQPTNEPTSIANLTDTVQANNGVPQGAGNTGKEQIVGLVSKEGSYDTDGDGIPNTFDADEDNDGIRNGIVEDPSTAQVESDIVYSVLPSSNLWATHGTTDPAYELIGMRLHVRVITPEGLDQISSVQCIDVPASIADTARIRSSGSLGDPESYPAEESLWKTWGYRLYKTTSLGDNHYVVSLQPGANMNVGDTFIIRVSYVGGSHEDFFIVMSYVLTDWPRFTTYNGTTMPTNEGVSSNDPVEFTGSTLEAVFTKAKDEDGEVLEGVRYSIEMGPISGDVTGFQSDLYPDAFDTSGADSVTVQLHELISFEAGTTYYITPVAETGGQRNGAETHFTRTQ